MINLESINNTYFADCKHSAIKYINNTINVTSKYHNLRTNIIIKDINAKPGKYHVIIVLSTQYPLCWYGTYKNAKEIVLKNGNNLFTIEILDDQTEPFIIGISYAQLPLGKVFNIYSIKIAKILDTPIQQFSNLKSPLQNFSQLVINKNNDINNTAADSIEKNILIVTGDTNCYTDNISQLIKKYYEHKYNIHIISCTNDPDYVDIYADITFDLIIKFWYGYDKSDPFLVYPNAIRVICVYDYIYWNKNIINYYSDHIINNFIDNISNASYISYASPIIKKLLLQQYDDYLSDKLWYPIYNGVDIDKFYYKEYVNDNDNKLIVGWAGNIFNIYKRFDILKNIVKDIDWIDFKILDKKICMRDDDIVNFYHNIDVIVNLSDDGKIPNIILEASASGRAWVSTNVCGVDLLNNIVDNQIRAGIIINNCSELLDQLQFLYDNRDAMIKMGKIGRKIVEKEFSWKNKIKQFGTILKLVNV